MITYKLKLNKIKEFFKKLPRDLGEHSFLSFLGLLFLSLILAGFLYYKYDILVKKEEPEVLITPLKFKEDVFQEILKKWEEREKKFRDADFKEYSPNPFQKSVAIPASTSSVPTSTEEF